MVRHTQETHLWHVAYHDSVDIHLYVVVKLRAVESHGHLARQAAKPAMQLLHLAAVHGHGHGRGVGGIAVLPDREYAEHLAVSRYRGAVPPALNILELLAGGDILALEAVYIGNAIDIIAGRRQHEVKLKASCRVVAQIRLFGQAVVARACISDVADLLMCTFKQLAVFHDMEGLAVQQLTFFIIHYHPERADILYRRSLLRAEGAAGHV